MKCQACGYERNYDMEIDGFTGDEKFIEINGSFIYNSDDHYHTLREAKLYACPKCKTVILEL